MSLEVENKIVELAVDKFKMDYTVVRQSLQHLMKFAT